MHICKPLLIKLFDSLKVNFLFIPSLCLFVALSLAFALSVTDKYVDLSQTLLFSWAYEMSVDNARSLLSTLASSIISITGISFSMVVVTLTLASRQFGARLIRNFIRDNKTQLCLGIMISAFAYCFVLLLFIQDYAQYQLIPGLAISFALCLGTTVLIALVFLIHHVAMSIQADNVINNCWRMFVEDIDRLFPKGESKQRDDFSLSSFENLAFDIRASQDGYIQGIDYAQLINFAEQNDLITHFQQCGQVKSLYYETQDFKAF